MRVEQALVEALHEADSYLPSADLFDRVKRSIDEDQAHRRRARVATLIVVGSVVAIAGFLLAVAERTIGGGWAVPVWSVEVVEVLVLFTLLLALGPAIRRLGRSFLADVFRLSAGTGPIFSRLLDIAYYLFFSGVILSDIDLIALTSHEDVPGVFVGSVSRLAVFLLAMGVAHAVNLAVLPLIGVLFGSVIRRGRRRAAGHDAPPISSRAAEAERVARRVMVGLVLLVVLGALMAIAGVLLLGVGG